MLRLTRIEEQILTVLWDAGQPLTIAELCDHAETMKIKFNFKTIQVTTKKLIDNGFLRVSSTKPVGRTTVRSLEPTMTADEYAVCKYKEIKKTGSIKLSSFISTLLHHENVSDEELDELAAIVEEMKKR